MELMNAFEALELEAEKLKAQLDSAMFKDDAYMKNLKKYITLEAAMEEILQISRHMQNLNQITGLPVRNIRSALQEHSEKLLTKLTD